MTRQRIDLYLRILFVLMGTLAAILSLKTYVADSEFWAITASRQLGEPGASASIYMKFLFYGLLKLVYILPLDNISHVLFTRLEFAAIAALTAFLFFRVVKDMLEDETAALVLTLILVSCSFFLTQSFRVRSDNLASLISLFVLAIVIGHSKRTDEKWIGRGFALFFLNLALLLTTPKSFYFLLLNGGFMILLPFAGLDRARKALSVVFGFLVPPLFLASTLTLSQYFSSLRWIYRSLVVSIEYFRDSFSGLSGPGTYLSLADFTHVITFLRQNPAHDTFLVASLFAWFLGRRSRSAEKKAYLFMFVGSLAFLFFHNQKLPFFIYSMLPSLFLGAGFAWKELWPRLSAHRRFAASLFVLMSLVSLSAVLVTRHSTKENSNDIEIESLRRLQSFIQEEKVRSYYDAIGLLPKLNRLFAFPSPNDRNNPIIMRVIANAKPDVVIYVTRMIELEPALAFFLSEAYFDIGGGVWLRSITPKILRTIVKEENGVCLVSKKRVSDLARETFAETNERLYLFSATTPYPATDRPIEIDLTEGPESFEWMCGKETFVLSSVRPRNLNLKLDLRFIFGFDSNY